MARRGVPVLGVRGRQPIQHIQPMFQSGITEEYNLINELQKNFFYFCMDGNEEQALLILQDYIFDCISVYDEKSNSPFIWACRNGMTRVIDRLIEIHIERNLTTELNHQNIDFRTGLMFICINGLTQQLNNILQCANLNINAVDKRGDSAIMHSCMNGNIDCIKILLSKENIDITLVNKDGYNMYEIVKQYQPQILLDLLQIISNNRNSIQKYNNSKQIVIQKINEMLDKIDAAQLNQVTINFIRKIYKISKKESLQNIKQKIEIKYKNILV